jgi:MFS family permease|tara:strand:- start:4846 stop:5979 length:1134 start_codon:yes stop_codon:yes gene_type:complete
MVCLLVALAALPDAMVPLALKAGVMDRWGVSPSAAHWFVAASLVGAFLAVPMLRRLQARFGPGQLVAGAALINGVALVALWSPVGFGTALGIRVFEGMADLLSLAVLLGLLEAGSQHRAGRRFGPAGLALMLGLAMGAVVGGTTAPSIGSGVFLIGAAMCLLLAVAAAGWSAPLGRIAARQMRVAEAMARSGRRSPLWPALTFAFGDRALGAVVSVTATLYLVDELNRSSAFVGWAVGVSLAILALGAWPAGLLADRIGAIPVRVVSVVGYAGAFAALAAAPWMNTTAVLLVLVVLGVAGAGLYPTTLIMAGRAGGGPVDMGGVHAMGSLGYFVGIVGAGMMLTGGPSVGQYQAVLLMFATVYLLVNVPAVAGAGRR